MPCCGGCGCSGGCCPPSCCPPSCCPPSCCPCNSYSSNRCTCGYPIVITADCMANLCPGFCYPRIECIPCCPKGMTTIEGCGNHMGNNGHSNSRC